MRTSILAAVAAVALSAGPALAAPVLFTDRAAFEAAVAGATLSVQGFDSLPPSQTISTLVAPGRHVAVVDGVTFTSAVQIVSGARFPNDRFLGSNFSLLNNGYFDFDFAPVSVFAVAFRPESAGTLNVSVDGVALASPSVLRGPSFLGIVDAEGTFSSVGLTAARRALGFVEFDDLTLGDLAAPPVPVPAGSFPFLAALAALGVLAHRRRGA